MDKGICHCCRGGQQTRGGSRFIIGQIRVGHVAFRTRGQSECAGSSRVSTLLFLTPSWFWGWGALN